MRRYGIVKNKTFTISGFELEEEEEPYLPYLIRGIIDGDGCIYYKKTDDYYSFSLAGASPLFLKNIMKILEIDKLSLNKLTETSYQIISGKRDDIYRILTRLYEHSTETTRLSRKYNKYLEFIEWYKKKTNNKKGGKGIG